MHLIELIPSIIMRFRKRRIGVTSDICKAFLQISIHEKDRDFLRFLWLDANGNEKVYRHRRDVFGLNSSPFLLGATIEYHLSQALEKSVLPGAPYTGDVIQYLSKSFYVDNCVASVSSKESLKKFIKQSCLLLDQAKFELRGWEYTDPSREDIFVPLLGLKWNPAKDILTISRESVRDISELENKVITKRLSTDSIYSTAHIRPYRVYLSSHSDSKTVIATNMGTTAKLGHASGS